MSGITFTFIRYALSQKIIRNEGRDRSTWSKTVECNWKTMES